MTDPVQHVARATAKILAPELGQNLPAEVEAALAAHGSRQRPDQYFDPVSLAGLVVAIADLAWSVYSEQRKHSASPPVGDITRQVRITLREQDVTLSHRSERITEIVTTEIIRHTDALDQQDKT